MASTRPSDLADVGRDGDTELTPITNAMTSVRGFPMELAAGGVVNIVKRTDIGRGQFSFTDQDGNVYVLNNGHTGKLVLLTEAEITEEPEAPAEEPEAEAVDLDVALQAIADAPAPEEEQEAAQEVEEGAETVTE